MDNLREITVHQDNAVAVECHFKKLGFMFLKNPERPYRKKECYVYHFICTDTQYIKLGYWFFDNKIPL